MQTLVVIRHFVFVGLIFGMAGVASAQTPTPLVSPAPTPTPVAIAEPPAATSSVLAPATQLFFVSVEMEEGAALEVPQNCGEAAGISWSDDRYLWVTDWKKNRIWRVDSRETEPTTFVDLSTLQDQTGENLNNPGAIVFDSGQGVFWIVDQPAASVNRTASPPHMATAPPEGVTRKIWRLPYPLEQPPGATSIPITSDADPGLVTGLALYDGHLWMAVGGGLCACVYKINPENGEVLFRFFPRCDPASVAIDPNGKGGRLWLAAERGGGRNAVALERSLGGPVDYKGRPVSVVRTTRVLELRDVFRPRALAFTERGMWVLEVPSRLPGAERVESRVLLFPVN
jgi:sugar lactone lactonase YvrE